MAETTAGTRRGWIVAAAAVSINLILGALYAWGVMGKALVVQWHWSKTDAALPFTVSAAAFAIMMIFAGRWQDRMGPRVVATAGGIMFGLGLAASAYASTPLAMMFTFGVIGGIGIGLCYSATTPPSIKWFPPARKGMITGIVVSGVGLAAVYVSPLAQFLLGAHGISGTFLILGIGATALICVLAQFLTNPPAGYVAAATAPAPVAAAQPKASSRPELDWHEMLRTRQFYQLWIMMVLTASAGLMIIAHIAIIAKEQASWEWGFVPVAMLAIFNTLGRIVSGYVSDRIGRTQTMVLAFSLQAVNMMLFASYASPALIVFGSAFAGLCYGTIFTLMPAATADFYGVRNLGVNYGLVFTAFGVAAVVGPVLAGRIRDVGGSYEMSYTISAAMLIVAAVLAYLAKPRPTELAVAA
jgi:OFA family oxalate/formate antiporter-like MFS transporter